MERELVFKLKELRAKADALEAELSEVTKEEMATEARLIELLQLNGATTTAKYDGVGSFSVLKPRVYASFKKDNEKAVFDYLTKEGRADMIKPTIHPQSLSAFVTECLENGKQLPKLGGEELITYYSKTGLKHNPRGATQ